MTYKTNRLFIDETRHDLISVNKLLIALTDKRHDIQKEYLLYKILLQKNVTILVARDMDKNISKEPNIVGMGTISWKDILTGTFAYIDDVVVDPDPAYRRQGIGDKLLLRLIDIARENNAECINLTSNPKNPKRIAANCLYLKHGFVKINDETNFYKLKL